MVPLLKCVKDNYLYTRIRFCWSTVMKTMKRLDSDKVIGVYIVYFLWTVLLTTRGMGPAREELHRDVAVLVS